MSGQYLHSITENASRLGARLQETFSERTRDLAIARSASSLYLDTPDDKAKDLRKQLDSSSDREKLDALKRLVAFISKGRNVSEYFAQVVKNVASQNLEIRKLVYIYLLRYAEQEPDLALLSINTFQKDLTDSSPLIRAMALRVLSGIKVPMIGSIVVLAIKKCAADISPYVRKAAALAIPKCYELDETHLPALITIISTLLRDRSPLSIGSVAVAFEAVCPTRLDLLHQQYRRLCKVLIDVDEWGQIDIMNLLLRYVRTMLPRPNVVAENEGLDPDVQLLLKSSEPLFQSRNPAVVLATTRVFYYAGTPAHLSKAVNPLLRLMHTSKEVERVVLAYLLVITRPAPQLFAPYFSRFLARADDLRQVKQDKIELLLHVLNADNYLAILPEFIDYADDVDDEVVSHAIRAIGRCAHLIPECIQQCFTALIRMIKNTHDAVVSNAIFVLKYLVQIQLQYATPAKSGSSQSSMTIISHLARRLDDIRHPQARASIIWLVGQYSSSDEVGPGPAGIIEWAPDVLRRSAKSFGEETSLVKLQIITLAAKLFTLSPSDPTLGRLSRYVLSLARYDLDYDVRDRARMLSALLSGLSPTINGSDLQEDRSGVVLRREQVRLVLFDGKTSVVGAETHRDEQAMIGSLSVVTDKPMRGDSFLPDWLEQGIEPSLRDTAEDIAPPPTPFAISSTSAPRSKGPSAVASPIILTPTHDASPAGSAHNGSSKGPWTDLDKFYENEDDNEEEHDSEDDDDDDDNDEEDTEDDEDEDEDEDSKVTPIDRVANGNHSVIEITEHGSGDEQDSEDDGELGRASSIRHTGP